MEKIAPEHELKYGSPGIGKILDLFHLGMSVEEIAKVKRMKPAGVLRIVSHKNWKILK